MRRYAVLIDAGFLKRKRGSRENPLTAEAVEDFVQELGGHPVLQDLQLHRVYFYDAPPLRSTERKPLSGGRIAFGDTPLARNNQRLHDDLRSVPFVALRMGDLRFRGWTLNAHRLPSDQAQVSITSEDLVPNVHQKGVDMRVGLDIASYVDAPLVTSTTLNEGRHVGQVLSYVRPLDAALLGRGPVWCS